MIPALALASIVTGNSQPGVGFPMFDLPWILLVCSLLFHLDQVSYIRQLRALLERSQLAGERLARLLDDRRSSGTPDHPD